MKENGINQAAFCCSLMLALAAAGALGIVFGPGGAYPPGTAQNGIFRIGWLCCSLAVVVIMARTGTLRKNFPGVVMVTLLGPATLLALGAYAGYHLAFARRREA